MIFAGYCGGSEVFIPFALPSLVRQSYIGIKPKLAGLMRPIYAVRVVNSV